MSAIFLSHSSKDNDVAAEIRAQLESRGHRSVFLDFDPADGIPAGRDWEKELYSRLRQCRAVIVLCSEHSMSSDWCFAEITHAKSLGKHIFPIIVAPCSVRSVLADAQAIDLRKDPDDAYQRLERGLLSAGLDPSNMFDWDGSRPPYPGLAAFQQADAAIYFGHDAEIQQGLDTLNQLQRFGGARLMLVLGASGSGKSSLVRAGLVPRLQRDAQRWLVLEPFRPLQNPTRGLAVAFSEAFARYQAPRDWRTLGAKLDEGLNAAEESGRVLSELAEELRIEAEQRDATVLVVIDQFEELLGHAEKNGAGGLLPFLRAALEAPDSPLIAVATLRSDFLADLQKHPALRELAFETLTVGPLSADGFARVIEGPAAVAGLELESGLVQAMLDDTATDDALPLLAFTLRELYERFASDGLLRVKEYRDLGGLEGSVARAAQGVLSAQALSEAELSALHSAFVAMVRINEEGQYARRPALWEDLPAASHALLERFVAARLLVSRGDEHGQVLEVAHEALFRAWQQLSSWLDEDRDSIRLRDGIARAAREWDALGREPHLLVHREARLEAAESLAREPRFELGAVSRDYVQAGVDLREEARALEAQRQQREIEAARRLARRTIVAAVIMAVLALTAGGIGYVAYERSKAAVAQLATTHWVSGMNERDRNDQPLKASHHFMHAAELAFLAQRAANAYLAGGLLVRSVRLHDIITHTGSIRGGTFTGDGAQILTWSDDGSARLHDLKSGKTVAVVEHERAVRSAVLSANGARILTASDDGTARIWERAAAQFVTMMQHDGPVRGAVFAPDERRALTWSHDKTARIWNLDSGQAEHVFKHEGRVWGARFDSSGKHVLSWSDDGTARVWDTASGATIATVRHDGSVRGAVFSPDERRIVSAGDDGTARMLDLNNPQAPVILQHDGRVWGARFDDSGRWIVTWSDDRTARVWDGRSGQPAAVLRHESAVRGASFSADARWVLSWSDDGAARVWQRESGVPITGVAHQGPVRGAVLDERRKLLLTWGDDRAARVWEVASGRALTPRLAHQELVNEAMFSADGQRIATLSRDGTARIWQFEPASSMVTSMVHDVGVQSAHFSANETQIITWSIDGTASSFDAGTGKRLRALTYQGVFNGARFSADRGTILTWTQDGSARLWDSVSVTPLGPPMQHEKSALGVLGAAFSPDGSVIMSWSDDGSVRVWSRAGARFITGLSHKLSVKSATFSASGKHILSWDIDGRALLWSSDNAKSRIELDASIVVSAALFTADGKRVLVFGRDGSARYLDAASGAPLQTLLTHDVSIEGAVFSDDEKRILIWNADGSARIWDSKSGAALTPPLRHLAGAVRGGALTRDGTRALTWSSDGSLRVWDGDTGYSLTGPMAHVAQVEGARFSADERRILSWSVDGTVRLWSLDVPAPRPERLVHALEVRSGSLLDDKAELRLMSGAGWRQLKAAGD